MTEQNAEKGERPMPMCGECHRPLGLYYAECLTCFGNSDLHDTHYDQWVKWQGSQSSLSTESTTP